MQMPLGVLAFTVVMTVIYSMFGVSDGATEAWWQELLSVSLATAAALVFALYIYLKQIRDDRVRTRNHVRQYMHYLLDEVAPEPDPTKVSIRRAGANALDQAIQSGHVSDAISQIIKVQDAVSSYQLFCEESVRAINQNNGTSPPWVKQNIDQAAKVVRELAKLCLTQMDEGELDDRNKVDPEEEATVPLLTAGRHNQPLQAEPEQKRTQPVRAETRP